jgi:tetratricopeptide (TPR) repeat protein
MKEKKMKLRLLFVLFVTLCFALAAGAAPETKKSSAGAEELQKYVEQLRKNPGDKALREKIIKLGAGMKPAPALPEDAERHMARGTTFAQKASNSAGYRKAIAEFEAATNAAPWLALAYYNLGVVQEKAGLFNEAIQSLNYYLKAAPDAKNSRDVKNKIYALEADAEAVQAGMKAQAPAPEPAPAAGKLAVAGKPSLEIEPEKPLKIIKMPKDPKKPVPNFEGNWYFKETVNGEERVYHAFEIAKTGNGDLTLIPPKRAADSVATVNIFEISDKALKVQMKWKMKSVVGYWKTDTYQLTLSDDGSKLTGLHNQQSVGNRNIDMDRVLYRQ